MGRQQRKQLIGNRTLIASQERDQLAAAIEGHRQRIPVEWKDHIDPQNRNHQRQAHRQAVRRSLLDLGLLAVTGRSIPLPIEREKRDKISQGLQSLTHSISPRTGESR